MPFVGDTFNRLYNWVTDRNNGVKIQAARMDAEFDGIATALSTLKSNATTLDGAVLKKDGSVALTGNISAGSQRITTLGDATALTDALNKKTADKVVATSGTSTAYTATSGYSLADGTVQDGTSIRIRPHTASGATPTLAVDSMTARAIRRQDGLQIGASELVANSTYELVFRSADTSWYLVGASLPIITSNALKVLRVNSGGTALEFANSVPALVRSARTSNTILGLSDWGTFIDITSGTFTQTFDAVATLTSGWWCYIRNSGTGDITLDPNSTETIDGLTSFIMYPGEVRLIQCDGAALRSIVITPFFKSFTSSGTFTKPPGYSVFEGILWGAGGGGSKDASYCSGGGGGAAVPLCLASSLVSATETVTIGAGGIGASTAGTSGTAGGNSTFGSLLTAYGGGGGSTNASSSAAGGGGGGALSAGATTAGTSASGGNPTFATGIYEDNHGFGGGNSRTNNQGGRSAWGGGAGTASNASAGGSSVFGGGGGGGASSPSDSTASVSVYGGAGGAGRSSSSGGNGTAPAGGGGGTNTGATAGNGARGELRIWGIV